MSKKIVVVNTDEFGDSWRIQKMDSDNFVELRDSSLTDAVDTALVLLDSFTEDNDIIDTVSSKDEAIQIAETITPDYEVLEIM